MAQAIFGLLELFADFQPHPDSSVPAAAHHLQHATPPQPSGAPTDFFRLRVNVLFLHIFPTVRIYVPGMISSLAQSSLQ